MGQAERRQGAYQWHACVVLMIHDVSLMMGCLDECCCSRLSIIQRWSCVQCTTLCMYHYTFSICFLSCPLASRCPAQSLAFTPSEHCQNPLGSNGTSAHGVARTQGIQSRQGDSTQGEGTIREK